MTKELIDYLEGFITESRKELFNNVLNNRTRYITLVLEDIYQAQNASAVLRSADLCGIMDVHVVENKNRWDIDREVALGSQKWLNVKKYNQGDNPSLDVIRKLKRKNYRIIATTPHINDVILQDLDLNKGKAAIFFGTELKGLSQTVIENADEFVKIPMFGFTESFNISVAAALVMHNLVLRLRNSQIDWKLTPEEKDLIKLQWLRKSVKSSKQLEERFKGAG